MSWSPEEKFQHSIGAKIIEFGCIERVWKTDRFTYVTTAPKCHYSVPREISAHDFSLEGKKEDAKECLASLAIQGDIKEAYFTFSLPRVLSYKLRGWCWEEAGKATGLSEGIKGTWILPCLRFHYEAQPWAVVDASPTDPSNWPMGTPTAPCTLPIHTSTLSRPVLCGHFFKSFFKTAQFFFFLLHF